jgi:hypothetical protein
MPNARKADFAAGTNPILKDQMTPLYTHSYPVAKEREDTMPQGKEVMQDA